MVVLLLTIGVIAMHSLGISHQMPAAALTAVPAAVLAPAVTTSAPVFDAPSSSRHPTGLMAMPPAWVAVPAVDSSYRITGITVVAVGMVGDDAMGGHGLMATCLAVISLLVLLLRRAPSGWFRPLEHPPSRPRSAIRHLRARWPAADDVSLSRLCVLRT